MIVLRTGRGGNGWRLSALISLLVGGLVIVGGIPAVAATPQERLVTEAQRTIESFASDPELDWFRAHVEDARGLLIIPGYYGAGFGLSIGGGNGVLLHHDLNTQEWSQPAFYTASSLGVGLVIGMHASESVIMIMTDKAMQSFHKTSFEIGAAGNVTLGPRGGGVAQSAKGDLVVYTRSKGLWVTVKLTTSVLAIHEEYNKAYYGQPATPKQILANEVRRTWSTDLQESVKLVGHKVRRCSFCRP